MTRLDLPGGWVELSDPRQVSERKRRRYLAALGEFTEIMNEPGRRKHELGDEVGDLLILCLVHEWSFGPVDDNTLGTLTAEQFDPIFRACKEQIPELLPNYEVDVDPKAPTSASTGQPPNTSPAADATTLSAATS